MASWRSLVALCVCLAVAVVLLGNTSTLGMAFIWPYAADTPGDHRHDATTSTPTTIFVTASGTSGVAPPSLVVPSQTSKPAISTPRDSSMASRRGHARTKNEATVGKNKDVPTALEAEKRRRAMVAEGPEARRRQHCTGIDNFRSRYLSWGAALRRATCSFPRDPAYSDGDQYVWHRKPREQFKWWTSVIHQTEAETVYPTFLSHRCDELPLQARTVEERAELSGGQVETLSPTQRAQAVCMTFYGSGSQDPLVEANPLEMLLGRRLYIIGHSHLRYVARELCVYSRKMAKRLDDDAHTLCRQPKRKSKIPTRECYRNHPNFYYFPVQYGFEEKALRLPKQGHNYTHIIYNRGLWDQIYRATPAAEYLREVTNGLRTLAETYPAARLTFYMQHYGNEPFGRKKYAVNCTRMERQLLYRALNLCAAAAVNDEWRGRGAAPPVEVFDPWEMTATRVAAQQTDHWGHHYKGPVLRNIIVRLLQQALCDGGPHPTTESVATAIGSTCAAVVASYEANPTFRQRCEDPDYNLPG